MLKRLELVGFKSFAEKTEFAFAPGVTAIVGPNGSGKSNLIDAVRWVLGEQSAKSLRGGEMTDVIFNGSASRKALGLAEVSMTFDNLRGHLATGADEVEVARRVYRSGESEYLINRQVCRLKDVKDLFLGSGAGSNAYSIIEQGRVDVLLQASPRDRRSIFEEAAGISRFKARKVETLRRLERVEQNLIRLNDILEEVEKQLRSVKLQAAKAQRYQEYSERLRSLRIALGAEEYRELTERFEARSAVLEQLRGRLREQTARGEACEADLGQIEEALSRLDETLHLHETELATAREQIAATEATAAHEAALAEDVERELARTRQRLAELTIHLSALTRGYEEMRGELVQAEAVRAAQGQAASALEEELRATERRLLELQEQGEADKEEHLECMRRAAQFQNDAVFSQGQVENLDRERFRLRQRSEQAAEHLASLDVELEQLTAAEGELQARLAEARQALAELRQERDRLRQLREETNQLTSDLRAQRSGLVSRIEVLEGLERSHEGLGTGVREVLAHLEQPDPGPWSAVRGILADLLTVRREFAPLIDLALGERAERFLVEDLDTLGKALEQRGRPFSGRVSFLPLATPPTRRRLPRADNPSRREVSARPARPTRLLPEDEGEARRLAQTGVVAVASQVVHCDDPDLADLPERLLGGTFIVRDLIAARATAAGNPGCRCITLQGELLEADGSLTVGTHHAEGGILSRKSELRELREEVGELEGRIAETERDLLALRERIAEADGQVEQAGAEGNVLAEQLADLRTRLGEHRQRRAGLDEEVAVSQSEMSNLEQEIEDLQRRWQEARERVAEAEAEVQALAERMREGQQEAREREELRQRQQQQALEARVALAQGEERLAGLRTTTARRLAELRRHEADRDRLAEHLIQTLARQAEGQRTLLECSAALAGWYLRKEAAERQLGGHAEERRRLRQLRQERAEQTHANRSAWQESQEEVHAQELEVNDLRHRRETLCARLEEDYQVDLAALHAGEGGEGLPAEAGTEGFRESAEEEIAELRRKLNRLGSVNLDALEELAELEGRHGALRVQYEDLAAAQKSLQEIIDKINVDSRRMFTETFETIRGHFQELFRKLFGGGMADVILEDEGDVLESGIEVMARPPGKELRSISLMSGGEKTLTAVALLLAVFRSKPSPFCLLDEVDAALDEANIGRFTAVLREFLELSQFIIITHSKTTMACADVLYGVTMEESGVSTRIGVRFEDWPSD
jgi:chromosome segregation protein